jgi:hypothetical protein
VIDKNGHARLRDYLCGNATNYHFYDPAPSVGTHYDEVTALVRCHSNYRFVRVRLFHSHGLALHTGDLRFISNGIQS